MKKTLLAIIVTALLTWITFSVVYSIRSGIERLWMVSAIKVPGRMAISEIQTDMNEGRYDLARAKLQVFMDTWQRFDRGPDSCGGCGIGDIMVAFSNIDTNHAAMNPKPTAPANVASPRR